MLQLFLSTVALLLGIFTYIEACLRQLYNIQAKIVEKTDADMSRNTYQLTLES